MLKVPKVTKWQNLGKKEVRHKFNVLLEEKHQTFLEADTIAFGVHNQACPKYPKQQLFAIFCNISRKKGDMKLIFCMEINKHF